MSDAQTLQVRRLPQPAAMLELLKPVTWFPPMWAYLCGVVSSGAPLGERWPELLLGAALAGPVVCGMSQAANDWCDRHVDAINEPGRPIPSGRVPPAWALGLAVAMSADFRIASEDSQFGIPAARMGLVYGYDGIKALVDLVGPGVAKQILYTGRRYPAADALRMGLIEEVVPAERLEATVRAYADEIAANAPLSIRGSKLIIRQITGRDSELDFAAMDALADEAFDSADYREGRTAFMEKRPPVFTGT